MGCLTTITRRIGGDLRSAVTRIGGGLRATAENVGGAFVFLFRHGGGVSSSVTRVGGMTCRMGLVCPTNLGYGIIWASDGRLITLEGGYLIGND